MKLRAPLFWFYAWAASLPFVRIPSTSVWGISVNASLILGMALIAAVALESRQAFVPRSWAVRWLYGFLGVCLVSSAVALSPARALLVTLFTSYVVALALAVAAVAMRIKPRLLLLALCISAAVGCAFGLFQFVGDLVGLPRSVTGLKAAYSGGVFGFPRIQAMSLEPLYFANYLLLPVSLLVGLGALVRRSWLFGALFVVSALLTLSRGGVGALLVVGLLWTILLLTRRRYGQVGIMAGVAAAGVMVTVLVLLVLVPTLRRPAAPTAQQPITPAVVATPALSAYAAQITTYEVGKRAEDRAYTRKMAIQAFREYPLLGIGPGNFGHYLHAQNAAFPVNQIVNNEYVEIPAETGLAGLVMLAGFATALAWRALRVLPRLDWTVAATGWGALFYLMGVGVQYYSFSTLYIPHIWMGVGLLLGVLSRPHKRASSPIIQS